MYESIISTIQSVVDWKTYIVGLDVSGNPNSKSFSEFVPVLSKGKDIGLKLTIHTA